MLADFLSYLMAISWTSGALAREWVRNERAKESLASPREHELSLAFLNGDIYKVAIALGRPYRWKFPQYLAEEFERGHDSLEARKAEDTWKAWSELGVMSLIAKKEGWRYKMISFPRVNGEWYQARKEQEEYLAVYDEAKSIFPHYATSRLYVDEYPSKDAYFEAINQFRADHQDLEDVFGEPAESDDPVYEEMIRQLFYMIDGDAKMRYNVFEFYMPYGYGPKEEGQPRKLYMALNRIMRAQGIDAYDCLTTYAGFLPDSRDRVVEVYSNALPTKEHITQVFQAIEDEMSGPDGKLNDKRVFLEGVKLMLRLDGKDPSWFCM